MTSFKYFLLVLALVGFVSWATTASVVFLWATFGALLLLFAVAWMDRKR